MSKNKYKSKQYLRNHHHIHLSSAGSFIVSNRAYDDIRDYRRLLVQMEETERQFDAFWNIHLKRLKQCLELRRFEQDFRELQVNIIKF